jgi:Pyruvate/2-oxoacid:ferredoxin oxidoreductase delta subunit
MCQFCVEHGEGKRWYLEAQNYALDLNSDLVRREYVVEFISGFEQMRSRAIIAGNIAAKLPGPITRAGKNAVTKHQQKNHFGQPLSIEDCAQVLDLASSITVIPCVCRMHEPGRAADEVCMLVTSSPVNSVLQEGFSDYEAGPDLDDFHTMTKSEALELLRSCEDRGLMHSIWTFKTPFTAAICNCNLASGCMAMKLTAGYDVKVMWRGEDVAVLDAEKCTACGRCAKRCPFDAISSKPGAVTIPAEKCWGCGICRSACSQQAIGLVDRRTVPLVAALW